MANLVLLQSALASGFIQALAASLLHPPVWFHLMILCGIFTSLWNHAVTDSVAVWCDRAAMCIGFLVDHAYAREGDLLVRAGVTVSAMLYLISKICRNTSRKLGQIASGRVEKESEHWHLCSHILLTCVHVLMMTQMRRE